MSDKDFSFEDAVKSLNKKFGDNYVSNGKPSEKLVRIPIGIFGLDSKIGGGLPLRKVMVLAGEYSSGKTTVGLFAVSAFQKAYPNKKVIYIDTDYGLDPTWATKIGVDMEKVFLVQPDTIEQVIDTMEAFLMTDQCSLVIFDSVANTPSSKELDSDGEQDSMGGIGKPMARLMRKITTRLQHVDTSVIIINQLRDKIGAWGGAAEDMPGGRALKFGSDITVNLRPSDWLGPTEEPTGRKTKFRVGKNRTAPPLQTGDFDISFDGSVDNNTAIVKQALIDGVVFKTGGWYYYKDDKNKTNGLEKFVAHLIETGEIEEIRNTILNKE